MKKFINIITALAIAAAAAVAAGCSNTFEEIDSLVLNRCLEPTGLSAKVVASKGNDIVFSWNVGKDAESYTLKVYTDKAMTDLYVEKVLSPDQVPFTMSVLADATYYYMVQATSESKEASNWATYQDDSKNPKSIKTFAVKDNLYLAVAERGSESISLTWSKEVSDYADVTNIYFGAPGCSEEDLESYTLTAEDIQNASATVSGLTPSQEYVMSLYYLSASRGEVNVWTMPDPNGLTSVTTSAQLEQAIKDGAKALVKIDGSPYSIGADLAKGLDVTKGFELYGEGAADGSMPVIYGSINITDSFDGKGVYCEGIEFNGQSNKCGFLFQHKEGSTANDVVVGNVIFRNCVITGYSKGLAYEWGKTMKIGEFTFDGCDIHAVNADGSGGGDGFDIRQATTIDKLNFTHCTIYNGFRTFLRIDANPIIGDVVFNNNTVMNLCFVDNTNNGGIFAFQAAPGSLSIKNNLFLNLVEKTTLTSANTKYKNASDLAVAASSNYFYGCAETISTDNMTVANLAGTTLDADPCYNAKAGLFNLNPDSDIAGQKIGASKWWTPFVEEPEDLTLGTIKAAHTWNLNNAKYFSGTSKKQMVRDSLFISASENNPIALSDGMIAFANASVCTKKGVPTDGYLYFKVDRPGSLVIRPVDGGANHIVVATGAENASLVTVKGGASEMSNMSNAQKIVISDITEETCVFIYASGAIALDKLAWSNDISQVNTALPAPAPAASPATVTAGEAEDVVITWDAVENAGSYSVVFNGKTYAADEDCSYTISKTTIGMLDPGSYKVNVYANPKEDDIYNTMSAAGVATFAIQPKGGSDEEGGAFTVKSVDELLAALAAKKEAITVLASGSPYVLTDELCGKTLPIDYPVVIAGETPATTIEGALGLSGTIEGNVTIKNLTFDDTNLSTGCFITIPDGLVMGDLNIVDVALNGYGKSVIYGNFETSQIDNATFNGISTSNWGTGQGVFDLRKGSIGTLKIVESTIVGGRDFIRLDATVNCGEILIANNTIDKSNLGVNGNAILYVRNMSAKYTVASNLWLNEVANGKNVLFSKASGVAVPHMLNNFYYNVDETNFFSGLITKEIATDHHGVVLSTDPVKNAAEGDYTLVNGLAMSNKVGASKWNPSRDSGCDDCFAVKDTTEFNAALSAGKTDLKLAAGEYVFDKKITAVKDLRLSGDGDVILKGYVEINGEDLGTLYFDNIHFQFDGSNGVVFNVAAASAANAITVKNCVFDGYSKSVYYDNAGLVANSIVFSNNKVINHGTGQGVFDIRKGKYTTFTIEQSTLVGGRDLVRADANTISGAFNFRNNTVDASNLGVNGNGILYVRAIPASFKFHNNLFINEVADGKKVILSKAASETVVLATPTEASTNFFYNVDQDNFFTGALNKETSAAIEVTNCPVKDAENGDYTLVDALAMSSNVGAMCWNPRAGRVTTDFTVNSTEELLNAIAVGKTAITLNYGTYDLVGVEGNESVSTGIMTLNNTITLKGVSKAGQKPVIAGGFKLGEGANGITAENLVFNGDGLGIAVEVGTAMDKANVILRGCDFQKYSKSVYYHSTGAEGSVNLLSVNACTISGFGTGQGVFDIRKGAYTTVVIENSTIFNGGRDFIRADKDLVTNSIAIRNNTFAATGVGAGNGLLWVRSTPNSYVVANNIFLNEVGAEGTKTLFAKTAATKATMSQNYFFNVDAANFWTGTYTQEEGTANGGAVLEADPCKNSAEFDFTVTNAEVKAAKAGDPRWR